MSSNQQPPNMFYPVANGVASSNPYVVFFSDRDPTPQDVNFPIQKQWLNTVTNEFFFLKSYSSTGSVLTANWIEFSSGGIVLLEFTGGAGTTGSFPVMPSPTGDVLLSSSDSSIIIDGGANSLDFTINPNSVIQTIIFRAFTSSGTYTPTSGMKYCVIECQAGGGGGGGCGLTNASEVNAGSGGGGGAYAKKLATAADIGASKPVTIGTGGAGGVGLASGSNGTATSVGTICSADPGLGGSFSAVMNVVCMTGGAGGTSGIGDIVIAGGGGTPSFGIFSTPLSIVMGGIGGSSYFAGPGDSKAGESPTNTSGNTGKSFGGGGGGAANTESSSAQNGGAGAPGVVYITEYI